MVRLGKLVLLSLATTLVSGCKNPAIKPMAFVKPSDDPATLVRVSGEKRDGIPLLVLSQELRVCGVDGRSVSPAQNEIFIAPGEHTFCVQVGGAGSNLATRQLYKKDLVFTVEYPNTYTVHYEGRFAGYDYWVKDGQGNDVPAVTLD